MRTLKLHLTGPDVTAWQAFLRGQGYILDITGTFDINTEAQTKLFQDEVRVTADGWVGNQTYGAAAALGFELVDMASEPSVGYPPRPSHLTGGGGSNESRIATYGPFEYQPIPNSEAIRITNDFVARQLVAIDAIGLHGLGGLERGNKILFHRKAAAALSELLTEWQTKGLSNQVLTFQGSFAPRLIRGERGSSVLSNHAFGLAFDINARWNPLGAQPALRGERGCVFDLVPIANRHGFFWGGHFNRRKDGMHFEYVDHGER